MIYVLSAALVVVVIAGGLLLVSLWEAHDILRSHEEAIERLREARGQLYSSLDRQHDGLLRVASDVRGYGKSAERFRAEVRDDIMDLRVEIDDLEAVARLLAEFIGTIAPDEEQKANYELQCDLESKIFEILRGDDEQA